MATDAAHHSAGFEPLVLEDRGRCCCGGNNYVGIADRLLCAGCAVDHQPWMAFARGGDKTGPAAVASTPDLNSLDLCCGSDAVELGTGLCPGADKSQPTGTWRRQKLTCDAGHGAGPHIRQPTSIHDDLQPMAEVAEDH